MNVFEHLQEDKQAALLTYFNDMEQDEPETPEVLYMDWLDNQIRLHSADYVGAHITSDTTCADILDGGAQ